MYGYAVKLALAASLTVVGVALAEEQVPITTENSSLVASVGEHGIMAELDIKNSANVGFGSSPILEEDLVSEVPQVRRHEFRRPVPGYLRDFGEVID